jgi:quinol-cytochrome oxidoreductase complex cytochrome b subunit
LLNKRAGTLFRAHFRCFWFTPPFQKHSWWFGGLAGVWVVRMACFQLVLLMGYADSGVIEPDGRKAN